MRFRVKRLEGVRGKVLDTGLNPSTGRFWLLYTMGFIDAMLVVAFVAWVLK